MPVTIQVAKHNASPVRTAPPESRNNAKSSQDVLELLCHRDASAIGPILETVLGPQTSIPGSSLANMRFTINDHGLVRAAYYAYSRHHHLVLRPEDIWFAVLTQFSYYVNAHAEEMRSSFVAHEGQKGLILRDPAQPDMGAMCRNMTKLIEKNIVDPKLREWIMPSFTTTTVNDEVVASVIMMGTLQKYFEYVFDCTACGIPTVTLLGEMSDWEDIQRRIEKLKEYGVQPSRFCDMLRPVLKYMVASFTEGPGSPSVVDFWSRMIDRNNGSGSDTLSGWMVAFCFWDEDGKCLAEHVYRGPSIARPVELLGVPYHVVDFNEVPAGFVSVPVKYLTPDGIKIDTKLLAGFVGYEETSHVTHTFKEPNTTENTSRSTSASGGKLRTALAFAKQKLGMEDDQEHETGSGGKSKMSEHQKDLVTPSMSTEAGQVDTLKPLTGWWMYTVKNEETTGMARDAFYSERLTSWEGGASTGYVQEDGKTVKVEDGLPWDWDA